MFKISQFTISEELQDRLCNNNLLTENRDQICGACQWGMCSYGLTSEPVSGIVADKIRETLTKVAPPCHCDDADEHQGWSEIDITPDYTFATTTAPKAYDGFGTLDIGQEIKNEYGFTERLVAIPIQHYNWQTSRYHSGLCAVNPYSNTEI